MDKRYIPTTSSIIIYSNSFCRFGVKDFILGYRLSVEVCNRGNGAVNSDKVAVRAAKNGQEVLLLVHPYGG